MIWSFDLLKFILALVIVSIHAGIGRTTPIQSEYVANLQSFAVPLFFVISSYLFFNKLRKAELGGGIKAITSIMEV